jgi:hypothetical protein
MAKTFSYLKEIYRNANQKSLRFIKGWIREKNRKLIGTKMKRKGVLQKYKCHEVQVCMIKELN